MLTDEQIIELREEIKREFPSIVPDDTIVDQINAFTDEQIDTKIGVIWLEIPKNCNRWREILKLLVIHRLLEGERLNKNLAEGNTSSPKNIQSVKVTGDISTSFFSDSTSKNYDPLYDTTEFGTRAKRLLTRCAKGRIPLIR